MDKRKVRATAHSLKRAVGNLVRARVLGRQHSLPHIAVYHANYRCNAACSFCSRGGDIANEKSVQRTVSMDQIAAIFRQLRKLAPALYIAGGEPLLEPNIEYMLKLAKQIGFYPVAVNTNATLLDRRRDVPRLADMTVVSIHARDVKQAAGIFRIRTVLAERMFENIIEAAAAAKAHGNSLIGNCVLTADNIGAAYEVLDFCLEHRIPLAVVPAIEGYVPAIAGAPPDKQAAYQAFIGKVNAVKERTPRAIYGSHLWLDRIRNLGGFDCRPTGIVSIDPEGNVITPCAHRFPNLPKHLGQITAERSALTILNESLDGEIFHSCDKNCLKACYAEPALAIEEPLLAAMEYIRW